jgi:FemAB-related protein (PEP-CTERM system-associated)
MTQVRLAQERDENIWNDYVLNHEEGVAYQLFAWKKAIERAYKQKCVYLLAESNARVEGLLPLSIQKPIFFRGSLISLPYCDVGGILANSEGVEEFLLDSALKYSRNEKVSQLRIRGARNLQAGGNSQSPAKVRMLKVLDESADDTMRSFKSKLRSQVKKTFRDGLSVKLGGIELLDDFYSVFSENMRDLGSPVHSKEWFSQILDAYGGRSRCGLVYLPNGEAAAAGIILCHTRTVSIPWASHLRRFNRYNPNMLLYWSFLEYASNNGFQCFDFGRSTPGEGTYNFKMQWGARAQPLYWEQWEVRRDASSPPYEIAHASSFDRLRPVAEKIIRKMPISLATFLGSRVRKYISL